MRFGYIYVRRKQCNELNYVIYLPPMFMCYYISRMIQIQDIRNVEDIIKTVYLKNCAKSEDASISCS